MNHAWNDARDKCKGLCLWDSSCLQRLEKGLERIVNAYTPQPQEVRTRDSLVRRLNALVQQEGSSIDRDLGGIHINDITLRAYGSYIIGVYCKSADLDITVEGTIQDPIQGRVTLADIPRGVKIKLIKSIKERLEEHGMIQGEAMACLHARIPIVTFVEAESEVTCDLSIGNFDACSKSRIISWLCQIDRRVPLLLALVKSWARHAGVVDPKNGGFNSFAITLLVMFHLQTVEPAIIPPICALFNYNSRNDREFKLSRRLIGQAARRATNYATGQYGTARSNKQSVFDLLASFLLRCGVMLQVWARGAHNDWRISVWDGAWRKEPFMYPYRALIEDPIDHQDNCARTLGIGDSCDRIHFVANAFHKAFARVREMRGLGDVDSLLKDHFHDPSATPLPSFITAMENQYHTDNLVQIPQDVERIIRRSFEQWDLDRIVLLASNNQKTTVKDTDSNCSGKLRPLGSKNNNNNRRQRQSTKSSSSSKNRANAPRRYRRPVSKRRKENLEEDNKGCARDQDMQWVIKEQKEEEIEVSSTLDFVFSQQSTIAHQDSNDSLSSNNQNQDFMKSILWALRGLKPPVEQQHLSNKTTTIPIQSSFQSQCIQIVGSESLSSEPIYRYCSLKDNCNNNSNNNDDRSNNNNYFLQHSLLSKLLAHHSLAVSTNPTNANVAYSTIEQQQHCRSVVQVCKRTSSTSSNSSSSSCTGGYSQLSGHADGWKEQVLNVAVEMEQILSYQSNDMGTPHLTAALRALRQAFVELDKLENVERYNSVCVDRQDNSN